MRAAKGSSAPPRRSCDEDVEFTSQRFVDDRRPDGRLADPRLTGEEQRARSLRGLGKEAVRLGDLPVSTDHERPPLISGS